MTIDYSNDPFVKHVVHPALADALAVMRDKDTEQTEFLRAMIQAGHILAHEATGELTTRPISIQTPLAGAQCQELAEKPLIIPILRAAGAFIPGFWNLLGDNCEITPIDMKRVESGDAAPTTKVIGAEGLPNSLANRPIIIVDPMLATGGSACEGIRLAKERDAEDIVFVALLAAPEGIDRVREEHPDVRIFVAAVDERLDENYYIVPGLGDAGDRCFGEKTFPVDPQELWKMVQELSGCTWQPPTWDK